ncbi:hypothetical protein H0E87_003845 [Populus deltoides]|uniref:Uncharacterized protein n=1 Tax=Populus deltoides TaxID=3696 RepID=A0A8T2ZCE2_POPDE|nr:hypothetical protein H0E87_003845 [Populus deltoides]
MDPVNDPDPYVDPSDCCFTLQAQPASPPSPPTDYLSLMACDNPFALLGEGGGVSDSDSASSSSSSTASVDTTDWNQAIQQTADIVQAADQLLQHSTCKSEESSASTAELTLNSTDYHIAGTTQSSTNTEEVAFVATTGNETEDKLVETLVAAFEYPALKKWEEKFLQKDKALSSLSTTVDQQRRPNSSRPPQEVYMGPVGYPPAQAASAGIPQGSALYRDVLPPYKGPFKPYKSFWNLPSAHTNHGAMLVLPSNIGQYPDVITRWESVTLNLVNSCSFDSNIDKVQFVKNLLGEDQKCIWMAWRMQFEADYQNVIDGADETQNIITTVRKMFLGEDLYGGTIKEQNRAY